mmetsp:Transcript_23267/g.60898  ORF Transcript_23267/g.60898 Transcript_23267/m.60898 type:complete len:298 (-) Transcript_23267:268-1161(-)
MVTWPPATSSSTTTCCARSPTLGAASGCRGGRPQRSFGASLPRHRQTCGRLESWYLKLCPRAVCRTPTLTTPMRSAGSCEAAASRTSLGTAPPTSPVGCCSDAGCRTRLSDRRPSRFGTTSRFAAECRGESTSPFRQANMRSALSTCHAFWPNRRRRRRRLPRPRPRYHWRGRWQPSSSGPRCGEARSPPSAPTCHQTIPLELEQRSTARKLHSSGCHRVPVSPRPPQCCPPFDAPTTRLRPARPIRPARLFASNPLRSLPRMARWWRRRRPRGNPSGNRPPRRLTAGICPTFCRPI